MLGRYLDTFFPVLMIDCIGAEEDDIVSLIFVIPGRKLLGPKYSIKYQNDKIL